MTLSISDELALLAVAVERAGDDPESLVLVRCEFQALWEKFKRDTDGVYKAFTNEAREEFEAAMREDLRA